jgi:beta-galactosidase
MKKTLLFSAVITALLLLCKSPVPEESSSEFDSVSRVDSGKPVAVMLTAYRTTLLADGKDRTILRVAVTDSLGREITSAGNAIRVYLEGNARLLPVRQGEPFEIHSDTAGMKYTALRLEDGVCHLYLESGNEPGKVKVDAKAEGCWQGGHEIHLIPAETEMLEPQEEQLTPTGMSIERMIGADVSFLPQMEDRGRKFYENGREVDAVEFFSDHGFNYIRLRIFVNPENEKGYSPGRGFCGLEPTLVMARRVRDAGMKLLLNFHYSDYWADPQQQNKPAAWAGLDFTTLKDSVYHYTVYVLEALERQGTPAAMVQVGNEINHGLLWPDGHISRPGRLAELLKAGVSGVREVDPDIPVMMHVALGGQNEEAVFWYNNMIARGVEFDIMGISYYPRWHGTLEDLKFNLIDLAGRYNKPVNVVEYGTFPREVHDIVSGLPDEMGRGTCIWEPLWRRGNLFNRDGEATDAILLYDELSSEYLGRGQ